MGVPRTEKPWAFLEDFRGKNFTGQWPTMPEMFKITVLRYGERPCFTIYDPKRISLNYKEVLKKVEAVARWLYSKGIRRGDRVAVSGKNWRIKWVFRVQKNLGHF
jgi:long-chain acyl-CoA synthetase